MRFLSLSLFTLAAAVSGVSGACNGNVADDTQNNGDFRPAGAALGYTDAISGTPSADGNTRQETETEGTQNTTQHA
jgi:hypothetical protein